MNAKIELPKSKGGERGRGGELGGRRRAGARVSGRARERCSWIAGPVQIRRTVCVELISIFISYCLIKKYEFQVALCLLTIY